MPGWKSLDVEFTAGPTLTGSDQGENGPSCFGFFAKTTLGPITAATAPVTAAALKTRRRLTRRFFIASAPVRAENRISFRRHLPLVTIERCTAADAQ